jgi:SAM-dependent MidA family methyltransferase
LSDAGSLIQLVHERGPLTVAAFMDLALYHPRLGYYARAARRSGRAGDFFTSVDVGPLFGELLEAQIAEMAPILRNGSTAPVDLVEAGAGNGRLAADILRAAKRRDPTLYESLRLHLVEVAPAARADQPSTLAGVGDRLSSSGAELPQTIDGVLLANELIDALPTHQVVMRDAGLREVYVRAESAGGPLATVEDRPSTPALAGYLSRVGATLEPGWRVEINLRALEWIREAARRLRRGFVILIDYGHPARELYSASHANGTLTTFARHVSGGPGTGSWLQHPGEQDITAHVDFTSLQMAAEDAGLSTLGFLDQTYFVLGILTDAVARGREALADAPGRSGALKTLLMPGGLGSTHKVLIFGRNVGTPRLAGCSYRMRVT